MSDKDRAKVNLLPRLREQQRIKSEMVKANDLDLMLNKIDDSFEF
jgi:hypothetical protein